ncbi:MAG: type I restriction enzyme HsdR N-terminal domain-containing protein [Flavobacteriales bacterium]|nr:type I restriction enzyme HsdR N-terminal domain-containing protein [Flavobacteriales bacterium]
MQQLNLPPYNFTLSKDGNNIKIFDAIRKKNLVLTPEEWVRQHFIQFLIQEKDFPKGLMAIEKGLSINGLKKRCDILCYSNTGIPLLMVECKAPNIPINQAVFDQIARYNIKFRLPYLIVTNGMQHYCAMVNFDNESFKFLNEIPNYNSLELDKK